MLKKLYKLFRSSYNAISIMTVILLWTGISYYLISTIVKSSTALTSNDYTDTSDVGASAEPETCNVYGINIHGTVVTYHTRDSYNDQGKLILDETSADDVAWAVDAAQNNANVKGLIVEIDSGGGSGEAGEEMMRAFKESKKPVVAYIRNLGASAAYIAATGAETIFASNFSDVGSIGLTQSYLQYSEKNKKEGISYIDLSSGKYKTAGSPDKTLTQDERDLLMRDINIGYEYFVKLVSENRKLSIEEVRKLADGSSVMGEQAVKVKLIDKIGLFPDAEKFLAGKIGAPVSVCWQN